MNREFLLNIFWLIFINLLIKPVYVLGINRTVQNVVGAEEFGLYGALLSFTLILKVFSDFGVQNFTSHHISKHTHLLSKYFPNLLSLKLGLSGFYLFCVLLMGLYWGYTQLHFQLLAVLALNQVAIGFVQFFRANIIGLAHYRTDSLLSVLDRLLMIIVCGLLLVVPAWRAQFQLEWFVYAHLFSLSVTLAVAFGLLWQHVQGFRLQFNWRLTILLFRESLPYALIVLLMMAYNRIDTIMLEQLIGSRETGIYVAAYTLLDAAAMFGLLFGNLLLPMFTRLLKAKEAILDLAQLSLGLIMAIGLVAVSSCWAFRVQLMQLLFVEADAYWGTVFGILMLSYVAISGTYIFGTILLANSNLRQLNYLFVGGIVVNVVLNYVFIPQYGAIGAAITTGATQAVVCLGEWWLVRRHLGLKFGRIWGRLFLLLVLLTGSVIGLLPLLGVAWWWLFMIQVGIGAGLAVGLGLVDVQAMRRIVR